MILYPHAKINIGLNILEKRPDGFHNIETVFYPVDLSDVLEFIESPDGKMHFESTGINIGDNGNNLCLKAYNILKSKYDIPPLHIHLHKIIPVGAGLGGGSSDGAFMLKGLNEYFELGLGNAELAWLAADMGSDCPFFIYGKPLFAQGKGDEFSDIDIMLKGKRVVLVHPGVFVSTKEAYNGIMPGFPDYPLKGLVKEDIMHWKEKIHNQFEVSIFKKYPEIGKIKETLYNNGALYAAMSGSGSSVFGIFENKTGTTIFDQPSFIWDGVL